MQTMLRERRDLYLQPQTSPAAWVVGGWAIAAVVAVGALAERGVDRDGIGLGLRLTARLAFLPFWLSYAAGAMTALFGPRFRPLKRRARELGLAFAAVLAVHLGLVAMLCAIGDAPSAYVFVVFGPGVVCVLLLVAASNRAIGRAIGPPGWWALRNVAMNYLAFDFAIDFIRLRPVGSVTRQAEYLPFAVLAVLAPALRALAWAKGRAGRPAR